MAAAYSKSDHLIRIINWKTGQHLSSIIPNDESVIHAIWAEENSFICLEKQSDGERYVIYNSAIENKNYI